MRIGALDGLLTGGTCAVRILLISGMSFAQAQDIEAGGQSRAALNPPIFSDSVSKGSRIKLNFNSRNTRLLVKPTLNVTNTQIWVSTLI